MNTVRIIAIGQIKEPYLKAGIAEYSKRLKSFCKFEIIELDEAKYPATIHPAHIQQALESEAQAIQSKLPKDAYIIALAIEGEMVSSEQFAQKIRKISIYEHHQFVFLIGGSHGLHESIKKLAQWRMSFSLMTFPHQLMRLILCEQIYRAYTINENLPYHK